MNTTKICNKCHLEKSIENFQTAKTNKDGYRNECKDCRSAYIKSYYIKNKEKVREKCKEYDKKHAEQISTYRKQYRQENLDHIKELNKEWRKNNRGHLKQQLSEWARNNPDKMYKNSLKWEQANPEKANVRHQRRRAIKAQSEGSFTAQEWIDLKAKYNNKCLCCGVSEEELQKSELNINFQCLHADHVVPLSKGGTNSIDNIQPLCGRCNDKKWNNIVDYR